MKQTDVENALLKMGMPVALSGFKYITAAVMKLDMPEWESGKIIALYTEIAKEFNSTKSRIERAIRHAFEVVRSKGNDEFVQKYIGFENTSNSDSLKMLLLVLKRENKSEKQCNLSFAARKDTNNETLKKFLIDINEVITNYLTIL